MYFGERKKQEKTYFEQSGQVYNILYTGPKVYQKYNSNNNLCINDYPFIQSLIYPFVTSSTKRIIIGTLLYQPELYHTGSHCIYFKTQKQFP